MYFTLILLLILNLTLEINLYILKTSGSFEYTTGNFKCITIFFFSFYQINILKEEKIFIFLYINDFVSFNFVFQKPGQVG